MYHIFIIDQLVFRKNILLMQGGCDGEYKVVERGRKKTEDLFSLNAFSINLFPGIPLTPFIFPALFVPEVKYHLRWR